MKIAIDAMGGDFAPEEIIKGSVSGAKEYGVGIKFNTCALKNVAQVG